MSTANAYMPATGGSVMYRDIEVMLFNTCNYNCAYCGFVTNGTVDDIADLAPFKDKAYIDAVLDFFKKYSSPSEKWNVLFSGGEPLITPNLDYLSGELIKAGNKIRYNTNLSVPIDTDEKWLAANPPHAVDVLMVSLHPESLEKYDVIVARMERLKALGYRIIPRMVAHPLLLDHFDRIDADMASLGLSFTPVPMFSTRYPKAYTDEQKAKIASHIKTFSNMIQLNGGLDTKGRLCHAGSLLFALGLGKSGKGNLYRCVSCAPGGYLGNIFSGEEIKFLTAPAPCCQRSQHCTCAFHFESNAVIGAEDGDNYEKMKNGAGAPAVGRFEEFVQRNGLTFKHHKSAPQGTEIGEQILIYKPEEVLNLTLGHERKVAYELTAANMSAAVPYKDGVEIAAGENGVGVSALSPIGGGIRFDFPTEPGRKMCVTFQGKVVRGNAVIAVYSGERAHFWHAVPRSRGRNVVTEAFRPSGSQVMVYVYADDPVQFEFERISVIESTAADHALAQTAA